MSSEYVSDVKTHLYSYQVCFDICTSLATYKELIRERASEHGCKY